MYSALESGAVQSLDNKACRKSPADRVRFDISTMTVQGSLFQRQRIVLRRISSQRWDYASETRSRGMARYDLDFDRCPTVFSFYERADVGKNRPSRLAMKFRYASVVIEESATLLAKYREFHG